MITEDYVSFEIAKLLKEKGFYTPYCYNYYFPELKSKTPCISNRVIPKDTDKYLAPTLQMAMKWLREVHKLHIDFVLNQDVENEEDVIKNYYFFDVSRLDRFANEGGDCKFYKSYEEACEAAIKYCLTNLIKLI